MDPYTIAHLMEIKEHIDRALEAGYTYNTATALQPTMMLMFGNQPGDSEE
jgi:hypothetical protein